MHLLLNFCSCQPFQVSPQREPRQKQKQPSELPLPQSRKLTGHPMCFSCYSDQRPSSARSNSRRLFCYWRTPTGKNCRRWTEWGCSPGPWNSFAQQWSIASTNYRTSHKLYWCRSHSGEWPEPASNGRQHFRLFWVWFQWIRRRHGLGIKSCVDDSQSRYCCQAHTNRQATTLDFSIDHRIEGWTMHSTPTINFLSTTTLYRNRKIVKLEKLPELFSCLPPHKGIGDAIGRMQHIYRVNRYLKL